MDENQGLTSSQLKDNYDELVSITLYKRLDHLTEQDFVEKIYKKQIGKKIAPGGDQIEYKLTKKGVARRKNLIDKILQMLQPFTEKRASEKIIKEISTNTTKEIAEVLHGFFDAIKANINEYAKKLLM